MAAIRFEQVWKRYGAVEAVKALSLTFRDGEMLALLGPSGCGKTSTLKMLAGIEDVSEGEIFFDGRPVSRLAPAERNIAMVFEDYALYPHLSVFENIAFPLRIRGLSGAEVRRRVAGALALLALEKVRHENVRGLSGGAQQRVSIGRALVRDPELILFDEPLSHLDGDQKIQLRAEIKRLQQTTGLTAILVTHDQTEAIAMSDRVAVMNAGVLQQCDAPQRLYDRPRNIFVAQFIGEPPMNLIPVAGREEGGAIVLDGAGWRVLPDERLAGLVRRRARANGLVLGFRPEHADLSPAASATGGDGSILGEVAWAEMRGDTRVCSIDRPSIDCPSIDRPSIDRPSIDRPGPHPGGEADGAARSVMIEAPVAAPLAVGDRVAIRIPPHRLNLFDAASGENLLADGPADDGDRR